MLANRPPETPDEYEFQVPQGLPVDQGLLSSFKEAAHSMGLSQTQMSKFADFYNGLAMQNATMVRQQEEIIRKAESSATEVLRKEWGKDFDARKDKAVKMVQKILDEKSVEFFRDAGFFSDPLFLRGMDQIAEAVSDDAFVEGKRTGEREHRRSPGGTPMLRYDNSPTMRKGSTNDV